MEYESLKALTDKVRKGTIHQIAWSRPMKTRKDVKDVITKETSAQVRLGITYDNMKRVQEARANGSLPAQNQGLGDNQEWLDDKKMYIKYKSTGNIVLRCAVAHGNKAVTVYKKNGEIVDKKDIESLCLASEFPKQKENAAPQEVFNISVKHVTSFK